MVQALEQGQLSGRQSSTSYRPPEPTSWTGTTIWLFRYCILCCRQTTGYSDQDCQNLIYLLLFDLNCFCIDLAGFYLPVDLAIGLDIGLAIWIWLAGWIGCIGLLSRSSSTGSGQAPRSSGLSGQVVCLHRLPPIVSYRHWASTGLPRLSTRTFGSFIGICWIGFGISGLLIIPSIHPIHHHRRLATGSFHHHHHYHYYLLGLFGFWDLDLVPMLP